MQAQMFLGIDFTNWNVIEKYFMMSFLSSHSAKNDLQRLLCKVRVEAHFPLESPCTYFLYVVIKVISCSFGHLVRLRSPSYQIGSFVKIRITKFYSYFISLFFISLILISVGLINSYSKITNKYKLKQKSRSNIHFKINF